jgi:archaellin
MIKMIKRVENNELYNRERQMSGSSLSIKTVCISLILVSFIIVPGCTTTSPASEGKTPVTSIPQTTISPSPTLTLQPAGDMQLAGNVYGISSDPNKGIDTITFSIGLPAHASPVNLTTMEIVFSTPGNAPVILTRGTRDSTSFFTTTAGGNAVNELHSDEEVDVSFRIKPVSGNTNVNIEVRPRDRAVLIFSRTVPAVITSLNVL